MQQKQMGKARSAFHLDRVGTATLFVTILIWGIIRVFLRSFIHEIDGWTANGIRYGISAFFWLGPLVYWIRRGKIKAHHFRAMLPIVGINVVGQSLWAWSPYFLEAGMMGFMVRSSAIFAVVFSFIAFPRERGLMGSVRFWIGLSMMLAGFTGMTFLAKEVPHGSTAIGMVIIFACALFWGMYGVAVRLCISDLHAPAGFSLICTATALPLVGLMALFGTPGDLGSMSAWRLFLLVASGIFGVAVAHVSYYKAMERVGAAISNSSGLLAPLVTAMGAYFYLGETFTWGQGLSALVLLTGGGLLISAQVHVTPARG